jgi:vacuolar-type H+-ATPase subunit E/Vma4
MLDTVLNSGHISLEAYINAYPEDALTDKRKMLDLIRKEKESETELLRSQLKEMTEKLNKAEATIKENEDTVSRAVSAIKENLSLKEFIAKEYENGK